MKDWKDRLSRSRIGERTELASIEGFWVKPRKLSAEEMDKVQAAQAAALSHLDRLQLAKATGRLRSIGGDEASKPVVDILSDKEVEALMDSQFIPSSEIVRLYILHGVAEHNFCEQESTVEMNDTIAREIMQVPQIASEIAMVVERFNRPLAAPTSATSGTSPNGSSTGPSST